MYLTEIRVKNGCFFFKISISRYGEYTHKLLDSKSKYLNLLCVFYNFIITRSHFWKYSETQVISQIQILIVLIWFFGFLGLLFSTLLSIFELTIQSLYYEWTTTLFNRLFIKNPYYYGSSYRLYFHTDKMYKKRNFNDMHNDELTDVYNQRQFRILLDMNWKRQ